MKKGFTLIELLIVIGILAVLSTAVIVVLNPAQLLAQARDTQRIDSLSSLRSALSLYLTTVKTPDMDGPMATAPGVSGCGFNWGSSVIGATKYVAAAAVAESQGGVRTVDGLGWVLVNFNSIPTGSPLSVLPTDPTNDATNNFQYSCDNTNKTFELDAKMESTRYKNLGADDVESKDGGTDPNVYEVGTAPGLGL